MNHRQLPKRAACAQARTRASFKLLFVPAFLALFVAFSLVFAAATNTQAFAAERIDTGRAGSLTLTCAYDGKTLDGLAFSVWRVASIDDEGAYQATDDFSESNIDFSTLATASSWDAAAKTLLSKAEESKLAPVARTTTATEGTATIPSLQPGLYLVSDAHVEKENSRYASAPCLIAVPTLDAAETSWLYDVFSEPKIEKTALPSPDGGNANPTESSNQTGNLSKTGDVAGICAAIACGVALACAAVAKKSRRKIKQDHHAR